MRALSHVPPAHWTERFGAGPQDLIAAAERDEWALPVLEGWARAAVLHGDAAWVSPLWDWWSRRAGDQSDAAHSRAVFQELRFSLSRCLGGSETERLVLRLAPRSSDSSHKAWEGVLLTLQALPPPWGAELGHRYLDALRDHARKGLRAAGTTADPWLRSLEFARWGLPPDCFERALEPWSLPEPQPGAWLLGMWHQQVDRFTETIRVRRRVMEEIPL